MINVTGVCSRLIGDLKQAFGAPQPSSDNNDHDPPEPHNVGQLDDMAARALTTVFGMDGDGRIKKEKARNVVEKLGLIGSEENGSQFELPGCSSEDELKAEELVGGGSEENDPSPAELLRRAFTVFDKDGNGFIEASEVKGVLECLGLVNGLDIGEFEKMVKIVDLNFDGKIDFGEFEVMMNAKI